MKYQKHVVKGLIMFRRKKESLDRQKEGVTS